MGIKIIEYGYTAHNIFKVFLYDGQHESIKKRERRSQGIKRRPAEAGGEPLALFSGLVGDDFLSASGSFSSKIKDPPAIL
jgi:hypothetical protein